MRVFACVRVLGVNRCVDGAVLSLLTQSLVVGPDFTLAFFGCGVAPFLNTELLSSLSVSGSSSLFSPTITLVGGPSSSRDGFEGLLIFHWAPRATKGIPFCTSMFKLRSQLCACVIKGGRGHDVTIMNFINQGPHTESDTEFEESPSSSPERR